MPNLEPILCLCSWLNDELLELEAGVRKEGTALLLTALVRLIDQVTCIAVVLL